MNELNNKWMSVWMDECKCFDVWVIRKLIDGIKNREVRSNIEFWYSRVLGGG